MTNENEIIKLTPFKLCVLQNFPFIEEDFDAITNYQLLCKVVEYLNNVIANENTLTSEMQNLQEGFVALQNYVDNYFDNLDVQEEINNKLDEMAQNGTLTNLIKNYVDPIYETFEDEINTRLNAQDSEISSINTKVDSVASGAPTPVSNISDMTDESKVYLLTTDGYWYYYDGSNWTQGGIYQATATEYDTTLTINNSTPNSKTVGEKINNNVYRKNLFNKNNITDNYKYLNGVLTADNDYFITEIIHVNQGDTLYYDVYNGEGDASLHNAFSVDKVYPNGSHISKVTTQYGHHWIADESCFVRITFAKSTDIPNFIDKLCIALNVTNNKYVDSKYELIEDKNDIDEISDYINLFNIDDVGYNMSINAVGQISKVTNYYSTNLIKVKSGDKLYIKYFGETGETLKYGNVCKYDVNKHFIERAAITNQSSFTANFNGYVKFSNNNPNQYDLSNLTISKQVLDSYVPYKRFTLSNDISRSDVNISRVDASNFIITFGDYKVTLFRTINQETNADNWNIKQVTDIDDHILIPEGTDIIGPIKLLDNNDYIGGVHGDETTNIITVGINNNTYDIENVVSLNGNNLTLTMKSTCYDEQTKEATFDRFITLIFSKNKIHVTNSFKAKKNCTIVNCCNGGLFACRNNIIKNIKLNNAYLPSAPTTQQTNKSKYNTNATINTTHGSITLINYKGCELPTYKGMLYVFTNETPMRSKIYFFTYTDGEFLINNGDIINGEFEYIFS